MFTETVSSSTPDGTTPARWCHIAQAAALVRNHSLTHSINQSISQCVAKSTRPSRCMFTVWYVGSESDEMSNVNRPSVIPPSASMPPLQWHGRHLESMTSHQKCDSVNRCIFTGGYCEFHLDPIWNDGALGFFEERRPTTTIKMSSDIGSDAKNDETLWLSYRTWTDGEHWPTRLRERGRRHGWHEAHRALGWQTGVPGIRGTDTKSWTHYFHWTSQGTTT